MAAVEITGTITGKIDWDTTKQATSEVQTVTIGGTPTGGTFTLTFDGFTTTDIAYNAVAATVDTALEALLSIGAGNVVVSGGAGPGTPWVCTFGGTLANTALPLMTASASGLTGGSNPSVGVVETTAGKTSKIAVVFQCDNTKANADLVASFDADLPATLTGTART